MSTFGRKVLDATIGHPLQVAADGAPLWHPVGITIDWSEVAAVEDDPAELPGGTIVPVGEKYLRHGQVLVKDGDVFVPYVDQTLVRGEVVILNMTVLENGSVPGLTSPSSDHPGGLVGGLVWKERLIANADTGSLADGPTYEDLEAALPELRYVG